MSLLVPDRLAPARVTGRPVRWAADFAVGGALMPLSIAWLPLWVGFGSVLDMLVLSGWSAAVGACVGYVSPILLDALRRGVPLWLLTVLAGVSGSAVMVIAWMMGDARMPLLYGVLFTAGGVAGTLLWLPYTFAAVTRRRTWPIVAASAGIAPAVALFHAWLYGVWF